MPASRRSLTPFGYRGRIFERRRHAEELVEQIKATGRKASWEPWGKRFKVFYEAAVDEDLTAAIKGV